MADIDHNTIQGILSGDENCYRQLFDEYYPMLTVFAKKYLGDLDTAREIVQDFFVGLYESRHQIEKIDSLKSYLFKSVKNRCLNYIKLNKIHQEHHEKIRSLMNEDEDDFTNRIFTTELENRIFQVVNALPERCRLVFNMSRFDGKKNEEIAHELKLSKRTVETQISKALKTLRNELSDYLKLIIISILLMFIK